MNQNTYKADYGYAQIVGAANPLEPIAKYVNVLKDEQVANDRYAQEWAAKQEAARQKRLLDESVIKDNNSKVTDRDAQTQPKVNLANSQTYKNNTGAAKDVAEVPKIQADTEHIKEKTISEKEFRQPTIDLKEAQTEQANAYAGKATEETKYVAPLANSKILHQKKTGDASVMHADASQKNARTNAGKLGVMQKNVNETIRNNKVVEKVKQREAEIKAFTSITAPSLEEKTAAKVEVKQAVPGKAGATDIDKMMNSVPQKEQESGGFVNKIKDFFKGK